MTQPRIVVIGGGTGTFAVLSGLKQREAHVSAVVSIADNGGSTGKLRDEYGVLPPGDIRQCLVALSEADTIMRELFLHRFENGTLNGHNFGNLLLTALERITKDPLRGVDAAHRILRVKGRVIPVSTTAATLSATYEDGTVLVGEAEIDKRDRSRAPITRCELDPPVEANSEAIRAIQDADLIVIAPGDIFTSTFPVLLVTGIDQAIRTNKKAKLVQVVNLVTKPGQTDDWNASRHVATVANQINREPDTILINNARPAMAILERYLRDDEQPVRDDILNGNVRRLPLLSRKISEPVPGDELKRSLLRHDPELLANAIMECI